MSKPTNTPLIPIISALRAVMIERLGTQLKRMGRDTIRGKESHPDLVSTADRTDYLIDRSQDAMYNVAGIIDAYRDLRDLPLVADGVLPVERVNDLLDKFSDAEDSREKAISALMEKLSLIAD